MSGTASLLSDLLDYLTSEPCFWVFRSRRARRARLIAQLRAALADPGRPLEFPDVVDATRAAWEEDGRVRIGPDAWIKADRDGLWVAAWLLADGRGGPPSFEQIRSVLNRLPPVQLEIFVLYRLERLDVATIAARLDMSVTDAKDQLTQALMALGDTPRQRH